MLKSYKELQDLFRNLVMLTQLGLSFITPLLVCLAACYAVTSRLGWGMWVYIPGFFFGLGGSFMVAWKFYQAQHSRDKKDEKEKNSVSFNYHE
ncbi:MAG: AtpZ/AtpI family protein [Blautia sp.]|nr:AtpZ/AtpI family protein [Blautia sp.]